MRLNRLLDDEVERDRKHQASGSTRTSSTGYLAVSPLSTRQIVTKPSSSTPITSYTGPISPNRCKVPTRSSLGFFSTGCADVCFLIRAFLSSWPRPFSSNTLRADLQRLGARDDLDQLLRDHGLAGAVVELRLALDHVTGVAGRVVHGAHARALFGGRILEERPEDLDREVARQEALE